jgi:hypothetical protein
MDNGAEGREGEELAFPKHKYVFKRLRASGEKKRKGAKRSENGQKQRGF